MSADNGLAEISPPVAVLDFHRYRISYDTTFGYFQNLEYEFLSMCRCVCLKMFPSCQQMAERRPSLKSQISLYQYRYHISSKTTSRNF